MSDNIPSVCSNRRVRRIQTPCAPSSATWRTTVRSGWEATPILQYLIRLVKLLSAGAPTA